MGSKKPAYSTFSQQQISGRRPALSPVHTAKISFALAIPFMAVGGAVWHGVKDLQTLGYRYDDVTACSNGFFPTAVEEQSKVSINGAGTTCSVTLTATEKLKAPVYVYYELGNFYQNHRAYVRDLDYFQLSEGASASQGLCTTNIKNATGADIVPCGVQAWSYFNDTYTVKLDGTTVAIDDNNIAWSADVNYRFGDYAPENMNTEQATRGGAQISGNSVRGDEHFVTWMRTAAFSNFRKLLGKIEVDIQEGTTITVDINNLYNTYKFNGEKHIVFATNSWVGGSNVVLPALYLLVGALFTCLGVFALVMEYYLKNTHSIGYAGYGIEEL